MKKVEGCCHLGNLRSVDYNIAQRTVEFSTIAFGKPCLFWDLSSSPRFPPPSRVPELPRPCWADILTQKIH